MTCQTRKNPMAAIVPGQTLTKLIRIFVKTFPLKKQVPIKLAVVAGICRKYPHKRGQIFIWKFLAVMW